MKMTHTRLLVSNFRECFLFYRDLMGFSVLWGNENSAYADFDANGHKLALFLRDQMAAAIDAAHPEPKKDEQDYICLIFTVASVEKAYHALMQKGITPINQPHERKDWGIKCFHFRDPDGNLIEINRDFGVNDA